MAEMNLKVKFLRLLLISAVVMLLLSCGGGGGVSDSNTSTNLKTGVAQKGPFVIGSEVDITELNSSGLPLRETFKSKISNKNGKYSFSTDDADTNSYYRLLVKGVFFDEHLGSNSDDEITLSAITNNPNNISINVLTHWLSQRTNTLTTNKTLEASLKQSKTELAKLFNIKNSNSLDISTNSNLLSEDNVMLLLLSGALMEASHKYNIIPQTIINEIGNDFADDGLLNDKGDEWFTRLQALIKDSPTAHSKSYAKAMSDMLGYKIASEQKLPNLIPLASRPAAIVPPVYLAAPSETITLDGSDSHDSGEIINFTWFRVDQQTQYDVPVSDRFSASLTITTPDEATVLAAPNQEIILLYALVVTDADDLTHTAVVKVIIRIPLLENNPPTAIDQIDDQAVITNEDTPVNITLEGNDPDGDDINFIINTPLLLTNGLLEGIPPNLIYTPTANFHGNDHFNFQVDDGSLTSVSARVNIIVLPVNDPPVADAKTVVTDEDTPVTINFTGSDLENDPLTFRIGANTPDNGSISGTAPSIVYTPATNFFGNDSFNYIANDGNDDSLPANVNIIVNPINDLPIANPQNIVTNEDTPINITLTGSDIEGDPLTYNFGGISVQNGSLNGTPPNLTYIPSLDFNGNDSFNFTVNDGTDDSLQATVNIQVLPVDDNTPPTAIAGNNQTFIAIRQDLSSGFDFGESTMPISLNGSASFDNEDAKVDLTYSWIKLSGPDTMVPEIEGDSQPNPFIITGIDQVIDGIYVFQLRVTDTEGLFSEDQVTITVNPANLPPTANAGDDIPESFSGDSLQLSGSGTDPEDGPNVTYEWSAPTGIMLSNSSAPNPTFKAPNVTTQETFTISLIVRDSGLLASQPDEMQVTVNPMSLDPTADAGDNLVLTYPIGQEGFFIDLDGSASIDSNGDSGTSSNLEYSWRLVSTGSTYSSVTFERNGPGSTDPIEARNPLSSFEVSGSGTAIIELKVKDIITGLEDTVEISIVIRGRPTAFVIDDPDNVCYPFFNSPPPPRYEPTNITLRGFDPEGGPLLFSIETNPSIGDLNFVIGETFSSGIVMYTPDPFDPTFSSPTRTTFTYIVIDDQGLESAPATVTINVCPA